MFLFLLLTVMESRACLYMKCPKNICSEGFPPWITIAFLGRIKKREGEKREGRTNLLIWSLLSRMNHAQMKREWKAKGKTIPMIRGRDKERGRVRNRESKREEWQEGYRAGEQAERGRRQECDRRWGAKQEGRVREQEGEKERRGGIKRPDEISSIKPVWLCFLQCGRQRGTAWCLLGMSQPGVADTEWFQYHWQNCSRCHYW